MGSVHVGVALFAVLGVSACDSGTDHHTLSTDPPPTLPPATHHSDPGAPTVADPLDITRYLDQPCVSLTPEQTTEYLGDDVRVRPKTGRSAGPSCAWNSDMRSDAQISVTYPRLTDEGLSAIYRNKDRQAFFHEVAPVNGYPAVSHGGLDNRGQGECLVTVGTSNSDYVNVIVYLGKGSAGKLDPCEAAHEVATAVVSNIQDSH